MSLTEIEITVGTLELDGVRYRKGERVALPPGVVARLSTTSIKVIGPVQEPEVVLNLDEPEPPRIDPAVALDEPEPKKKGSRRG